MLNTIDNTDHMNSFCFRLKYLRERKGSLTKVSSDLRISRQTLSAYEYGDSKPDIEMVCRLADYFNVSTDYLLGFSDVAQSNKEHCGLSEKTYTLLAGNPQMHQFIDYFTCELFEAGIEKSITDIGKHNNVENAWETTLSKELLDLINKSFDEMVKDAAFSATLNAKRMETYLKKNFPKPVSFSNYFTSLNLDAKNVIIYDEPNFNKLSDEEQYETFIRIICNTFFEVNTIRFLYASTHEKVSKKIIDIIENYVYKFNINTTQD